jgi:uncharacterized protein (TIGR03083 family)
MTDADPLRDFIDRWAVAVAENVTLLRSLDADDWDTPTDLPGWNVRAVASHLAHLESELAGNPQAQVDVQPADHLTGAMNVFTESGVLARADWTPTQIIDELESSAFKRHRDLLALLPLDPAAPADGFATQLGWTWATLLSNRVVDQWMHEQDIRRATNRPGGLTGVAAAHTFGVFASSFPFVLGKRVGAPAGTTAVLEISGEHPATLTAVVGDDGRAAPLDAAPADPTVRIAMDFETLTILSGGRRGPDQVTVSITGDAELGDAILANLGVTP